MLPTSSSTLVFSLGQDGYDRAFASNIDSHRAYCERYGYSYFCIAEPGDPALGRENIWLKVMALLGALISHENVLYLDTDVRIQPTCPPVDAAVNAERPIGLVAGHSGRVNAGVILAHRTAGSLEFLREWMSCLGKPLARRHDVGWGENGHLIRLAREHDITLLDTRWNNTFQPDLDDHIRHYTGPLRTEYSFSGPEQEAWDEIKQKLALAKMAPPLDIIRAFHALKAVYERALPKELFAPFDIRWTGLIEHTRRAAAKPGQMFAARTLRRVHVAEAIADDSPNAYVLTLRDGLTAAMGSEAVTSGIDRFWEGEFAKNEILHIEWIESLFSWKVPDEAQIARFEARMSEIGPRVPIVYTAHNFDLMPTYGASRERMLQSLARNGSMIFHLGEANIDPYNRHHAGIPGLAALPTAVVPHGDYQPYFRIPAVPFEDPALDTAKIKILVFGHIRTEDELRFCTQVAELLGDDEYQVILTGSANPDVVHWKENLRLREEWDGGIRRLHVKVPTEQVASLVDQCDGLLVPRFARLNSGVQFLAYTLLKPAFVPAENSMEEKQSQAVGGGIYKPHDAAAAADAIRRHFAGTPVRRLCSRFGINGFNYRTQHMREVGAAHIAGYERALSFHRQKFGQAS